MATYKIKISNAIMEIDAETSEEAVMECEDILETFLSSWNSAEVV